MVSRTKWTVADYHRLIDTGILDERRLELIQGDLIEMSPESPLHSHFSSGVAEYLRFSLQGLAYVREAHPITLSDSEPSPDVTIVRLPRSRYRQQHPTAQDIFWLVEISNTTLAYDLNEKKQIYAQGGIQEYWFIELLQQQIYVFRQPLESDYQSQIIVRQGIITPLSFPDIQLSVSRLFND